MKFSTWITLNDAQRYDTHELKQDFGGLKKTNTPIRNEIQFAAECVDFKDVDEFSKWLCPLSHYELYSNWECSIQFRLNEEENIMTEMLNKMCLRTALQDISISLNLRSMVHICKTLIDVGLSDILDEIKINASVADLVKIVDGSVSDEDAIEYISIINHNIDSTRKTVHLIEQFASSEKNNLQLGLANFYYASYDYNPANRKGNKK